MTTDNHLADKEVFVSVSEVHDFYYCPYAWWFKRIGKISPDTKLLKEGSDFHIQQQTNVVTAQRQSQLSTVFFILAIVLALIFIVLLILRII